MINLFIFADGLRCGYTIITGKKQDGKFSDEGYLHNQMGADTHISGRDALRHGLDSSGIVSNGSSTGHYSLHFFPCEFDYFANVY